MSYESIIAKAIKREEPEVIAAVEEMVRLMVPGGVLSEMSARQIAYRARLAWAAIKPRFEPVVHKVVLS